MENLELRPEGGDQIIKISNRGFYLLVLGIIFFILSSCALVTPDINGRISIFENGIAGILTYTLLIITNVVNSLSAFYLFRAIRSFSRSSFYRVWTSCLGAVVVMFVIFSSVFYISGIVYPILTGWKASLEPFLSALMVFSMFSFPLLVPAQAVVFISLLISVLVLYFLQRRAGSATSIPTKLIFALILFSVMALSAIEIEHIVETYQTRN